MGWLRQWEAWLSWKLTVSKVMLPIISGLVLSPTHYLLEQNIKIYKQLLILQIITFPTALVIGNDSTRFLITHLWSPIMCQLTHCLCLIYPSTYVAGQQVTGALFVVVVLFFIVHQPHKANVIILPFLFWSLKLVPLCLSLLILQFIENYHYGAFRLKNRITLFMLPHL